MLRSLFQHDKPEVEDRFSNFNDCNRRGVNLLKDLKQFLSVFSLVLHYQPAVQKKVQRSSGEEQRPDSRITKLNQNSRLLQRAWLGLCNQALDVRFYWRACGLRFPAQIIDRLVTFNLETSCLWLLKQVLQFNKRIVVSLTYFIKSLNKTRI